MSLPRPLALFGLCLGLSFTAAAACSSERATSDDDAGVGGGGGGAGATTSPGDAYQSSARLAEAELSRVAGHLASDALDGRDEGTPGGAMAREFLIAEMQACGIEPAVAGSFEQPITSGQGVNLLGRVPGRDPALAERTVVVSAHYDHLGHCGGDICNGADDNAAGVAIALAVACAMADAPPPRSVLLALWDAEEPPTFLTAAMGSQFYASNPVVPLEQTDAVVVLDLVGSDLWPGYGGHFLLGAELSPAVASAVERARRPVGLLARRGGLHLAEEQPLGLGRQPWSDYDAFRNAGKPVLFLSNGQNKRYHTPADELAALDLPKMALEAQYLAAIIGNLAHAADTPAFDPAGADYATDAATVVDVLTAALAPGGLADSVSASSRDKLEGDLADATAIADALTQGGVPTEAEIRRLRDGTQRIMCLAGTAYEEALCAAF